MFKMFPPFFFVIAIISSIQYLLNRFRINRIKLIRRIKQEERYKLRTQTAQDLHDGLGNKLARINILSDILLSQIADNEQEKLSVAQKIKTNANELHSAAKDILWALDPDKDSLMELAEYLMDYGQEMFQESSTDFKSVISFEEDIITLPRNTSRNVLMIFKEAINNALKYSRAKTVSFKLHKPAEDKVIFILEDDGKGFDVLKANGGYGLNNMKNRAQKINASLNILSGESGTTIFLTLAPFN